MHKALNMLRCPPSSIKPDGPEKITVAIIVPRTSLCQVLSSALSWALAHRGLSAALRGATVV